MRSALAERLFAAGPREKYPSVCPLILHWKRDPLLKTPGANGLGDPIKDCPGALRHHAQSSETELVAVTVERESEVSEMPVIKNSLQPGEELVWAMKCN